MLVQAGVLVQANDGVPALRDDVPAQADAPALSPVWAAAIPDDVPALSPDDVPAQADVPALAPDAGTPLDWRIEVTRRGKYWQWRKGRGRNRQSRYGGKFELLSEERKAAYHDNQAKWQAQRATALDARR